MRSCWTLNILALAAIAVAMGLVSPGHTSGLAMLNDDSSASISSAAKLHSKDFSLKAETAEMQALKSPDWLPADPGEERKPFLAQSFSVLKSGPRSPPQVRAGARSWSLK